MQYFVSFRAQNVVLLTQLLKHRINKSEAVGASTTDAGTSKAAAEPSPTPHSSPGVTTRRMSSISPTSPGVTTRRMATISSGGINRRLIIE